jgi:hypothetical protein
MYRKIKDWSCGDTAQMAVNLTYEVYGVDGNVSSIINQMRKDRRAYNGGFQPSQVEAVDSFNLYWSACCVN